jgi:hypothetical protein
MARQRRPGATKGSAEWKRRVRAGQERAYVQLAAARRIAPGELLELERSGSISERLRAFVGPALEEGLHLVDALGGEAYVSPQKLTLIRDVTRLGVLLAGLVAQALQARALDLEAVAKITSLANARKGLLAALGLERHAREVDLRDYLAGQREGTSPDAPAPAPAPRSRRARKVETLVHPALSDRPEPPPVEAELAAESESTVWGFDG